ncbi:MAG: hypothetical protein ACREVM_08125 [Burkholderiales bacterium]
MRKLLHALGYLLAAVAPGTGLAATLTQVQAVCTGAQTVAYYGVNRKLIFAIKVHANRSSQESSGSSKFGDEDFSGFL